VRGKEGRENTILHQGDISQIGGRGLTGGGGKGREGHESKVRNPDTVERHEEENRLWVPCGTCQLPDFLKKR